MRKVQIRMQCLFLPVMRTSHREPDCGDLVCRFTSDLGLLAVGKYLCDLCPTPLPEIYMIHDDIARNAEAVYMQSLTVRLTDAVVLMVIIVVMLFTIGSTPMAKQEPDDAHAIHAMQDISITSMDAGQVEMLSQEVANKEHQLELANSELDAMANYVAKLEAELQQSKEHSALQDERLNCALREKETLSEMLRVEVETYELLLERESEKAQRTAKAVAKQLSSLHTELQQVRKQSALQDERLDRLSREKEMLELEVETCEALLEQERDQAQRLLSTVKRRGCPLDTGLGLDSKYAKDALNGLFGDCSIIVNYENSLSNPVGAIVHARDKQQRATKILCAFAAPKRGITAANLVAVKEHARRQGDAKLVLDSVRNAETFWQHMGFVADAGQPDNDLVRMHMPLNDVS